MSKIKAIQKHIRKRFRHCGKYGISSEFAQVSYYEMTGNRANNTRGKQQRKYDVELPQNREFNNKRSRRIFEALVQANFGRGGYHIVLTYAQAPDEAEAKQKVKRYIEKVNRHLAKKGEEKAKWIMVTETGKRIHHHLIIKCKMDMNELEKLWQHGYTRMSVLKPDNKRGLLGLIGYIAKEWKNDGRPKNKRHWSCSQKLVRPWDTVNDNPRMMSKKKFHHMTNLPEDSEEMKRIIEGDNPGYELLSVEKEYIEEIGAWYFFCRLHLKECYPQKQEEKVDNME